jgi:hypothetical protein
MSESRLVLRLDLEMWAEMKPHLFGVAVMGGGTNGRLHRVEPRVKPRTHRRSLVRDRQFTLDLALNQQQAL